jgi:hypothetical protein
LGEAGLARRDVLVLSGRWGSADRPSNLGAALERARA